MLDTLALDIRTLAAKIAGSAPTVGVIRGRKVIAASARTIVSIRPVTADTVTVTVIARGEVPTLVSRENLTVPAAITRAVLATR